MRKITYLLSLFFILTGTTMAQTYKVPDASSILTAEQVRNLTEETPIAFGPVQKTQYGTWYDGVTGTYATTSAFTEANIFIWEPILEENAATGKGYIRKRSITTDDNYLQTRNTTTFGAKGTAQVFYPVMPIHSTGTGNQVFDHDNIFNGYDESNLVRFVCGEPGGTTWFNFNGKQYNNGGGIWTACEVHSASSLTEIVQVNTWDELSNNKAYTLVSRQALMSKTDATGIRAANKPDPAVSYDIDNKSFHFAILKNSKGKYFLYSIKDGKLVGNSGSYVDEPEAINHEAGLTENTFFLYFDNSHVLNLNNNEGLVINNYDTKDPGNSFVITEAGSFTPSTELLNLIEMTLAEMVQNRLNTIGKDHFPQKDENVDFEPTWPSEYENGGFADFDFLKKAKQAVTDNDETALAEYKAKLDNFIRLSNQHGYPISITLKYPVQEYGTAYLPFNTAKPDGLTLYTCEAVNGNALTLLEAGDFKKNYAYVVKAEEGVRGKTRQIISYGNQKGNQENTTSLLKGTHDGCVAPTGSYVLQMQSDGLGFYLVDGSKNINVPAGKCYLQWPEGGTAGISRFVFPEGETTGIDAIFDGAQTENAPTYDLSGRRVKNAAKGIYIIGGKKVLVK